MNHTQQFAGSGAPTERALIPWLRRNIKLPAPEATREFIIMLAVSLFTLLYGLVPIFGGDQLGLLHADAVVFDLDQHLAAGPERV